MHRISGRQALADVFAGLMLMLAGLLWPGSVQAQAVSPYCPTQAATIISGGSATFDISACDGPWDVGMEEFPPAVQPSEGTVTLTPAVGGVQFATYHHDGDPGATSDTFTLLDQNYDHLTFNITITPATSAITIAPATLPTLTAGAPVNQTLSATGGTAPYAWSVVGGALPPGLSFSAGGVLSGTPTQRGTYTFQVRTQDALGETAERSYGGTVQNPSLALVQASGTAVQGAAFSQTLSTSGGVAPYSYMLETGTLPVGMSISSAGVVSGTTSVAPGSYPVGVRVTDASTGPGVYFEVEPYTLIVAAAPTVTIAVLPASVAEDDGIALVYTVTRSAALSSPTVVDIGTSGTATAGGDYTGHAATVTIPAGAISATLSITPTADTAVETDETVILTVNAGAGAGYAVGVPSSATGTILNDDVPTASITVSPVEVTEDGAASLVYTVTLDQPSPVAIPVGFSVSGTATSGTDYAAVSSPLVIAPGATTGTIVVDPTPDTTVEADETVVLTLTADAGAGYAVGTPASATGTILDDDLPSLSINDVIVTEGNAGTTTATFTVSLSAPAGPGGVTFDIATADGTASAGSDYVANNLTGQTIPAGSSSYGFSVQVNGDLAYEPHETFSVNVSNVIGATVADGQGVGTIINDDPPLSLAPAAGALPGATVAAAYSQTFTASGGTAPSAFAVTAGTLPPGLTLSPTGVLGGTPTAGGTFNFTVRATDSTAAPVGPLTAELAYSLTVAPPTIAVAPTTLPGGTVGTAYSQSVTASGGTAPYSFAVTAGVLPAGLSLGAGGAVTGSPTAPGTFNFTITATDSSTGTGPYSGARAYAVTVVEEMPVANPVSTTVAYGSGANPVTLNITGGAAASVAIASAPLNGTAVASGTSISYQPDAGYAGPDSFTYTATGSSGTSAPALVTVTVIDPVITVSTADPLSVQIGAAFSASFTWSGGAQPYSGYQVDNLPAGLSVTASTADSVTVSGTPTQGGTFNLGVSATDSSTGNGPFTAGQSFVLTVSAPTLNLTPAPGTLDAHYATAFAQTFAATGGVGPYSYVLTGALPAGMALAGDTLSGTPTQTGSYAITVTATDTGSTGAGAPFTVSHGYTLEVPAPTLAIGPATLANATAGTAYSQSLAASGGVAPYAFTITAGALPTGLTLASDGTMSGTPTVSGSFNLTIGASDAHGQTATRSYTLAVDAPSLTLGPTTGALPGAVAGEVYSHTLQVDGGIAPYTAALTGTLPTGLAFDGDTLTLTGTPTAAGSYVFTITVSDSTAGTPGTASASYTLVVAAPTLTLTPATVAGATAGVAWTQTFVAAGGAAPYRYAIASGSLPAGLALDAATGVLAGTPTEAGGFAFAVTATDSTPGTPGAVTVEYTLAVTVPVIVVDPDTLPGARLTFEYAQALSARGGTAPYAFTLDAGALPVGLVLAADGGLSGTPLEGGSFAITIRATDTLGFSGTRSYALEVIAQPDPTRDPEVRGLLDAQAAASRRFATSQIINFQQRLEQLHGRGGGGSRSGLTLATREQCPDNRFYALEHACHRDNRDQARQGAIDDAPALEPRAASAGPGGIARGFGVWAAGTLRSGNFDGQAGGRGFDFETEGVSAGIDTRLLPQLVVGAGLGYGQDSTTVGENGSHLRGRARTIALYGSFQPGEVMFVDGLVGYQRLSFDLERYLGATGGFARGARDGDLRFASVSLGADLVHDAWTFTPYARLDAMHGALDGYTERGDPAALLAYGEQDVDTTTGNLGLNLAFRHAAGWGMFSPRLRLEYQHDITAEGGASMRYADGLGPAYLTQVEGFDRRRLMLGLGLLFDFGRHSLQLDYRGIVGSGEQRDNAVQLMFQTGR